MTRVPNRGEKIERTALDYQTAVEKKTKMKRVEVWKG